MSEHIYISQLNKKFVYICIYYYIVYIHLYILLRPGVREFSIFENSAHTHSTWTRPSRSKRRLES